MYTVNEIAELRKKCYELELENREILAKYSDNDLALICNGIGADSFPYWLRWTVTSLHPSLEPVAFIHDVEWHERSKSGAPETPEMDRVMFTESNDRFKRNGYKAANQYGWYNPRRYKVRYDAWKFAAACNTSYGWNAWNA